jgi:UDP-N-acetyl-D-mannosaminuronic acid dehydrogenase
MEMTAEAPQATIKSVCVVGLGTVGGPTARYFAGQGIPTYGCDINPAAARPFEGVLDGAATSLRDLPPSDLYIVTVDTGFRGEDPVTNSVFRACEAIRDRGTPDLVSIESTVPIGTCARIGSEIFGLRQRIVHVPHRWWMEDETNHGVRQKRVVGGTDEEAVRLAVEFYGRAGIPLVPVPDLRIAELCKSAENTDRYLKIAYAELLKMICDDNGMDFEELRRAMNSKWNVEILEARAGIGGTCLPKDILYVKAADPEKCHILDGARAVDELYRKHLEKIL